MKFKHYLLNEKTYRITKDVDFIYKTCFKKFLDNFKSNPVGNEEYEKVNRQAGRIEVIRTSNLKSKECQLADKINPCTIECGIYPEGSFYRPGQRRIVISLSITAMSILSKGMVSTNNKRFFREEIKESRVKATIWHELSHWLNDTFHNFHITKILKLSQEVGDASIIKLHKQDVNMTHFEIDAQIHAIKGIKSVHRKEWDNMTLEDLYIKNTSLGHIYNRLVTAYDQNTADIWQKALVKRMAREGLLGKNMKRFVRGEIR